MWPRATVTDLCFEEVIHRASAAASWHTAYANVEDGWGRVFFSRYGAQVRGNGYTILPDFAEYLPPPDGPSTGMASMPPSFPITSFDAFQATVYKTFPKEVRLQHKQNRTLWRPIVNAAVNAHDKDSRNAGAARYSLGKALLFGAF